MVTNLPASFLTVIKPLPCLLTAMWLTAGCASKPPPAFTGTATTLSVRAQSVESEGARVTAEIFADRERCKTYFDLPGAYSNGLAILYVKIENLDPSRSLLAQRSDIHLVLGQGNAAAGRTSRSTAGGEAAALLGATVGSLPLLFIGGAIISNAAMVQSNFVTKEFRDDTIGPGASAAGFVYYQLDQKTLLNDGGTVKVTLHRPLSQSDITVEIPLPKP